MNWIFYAFATALTLATADFFVKMAAGKLSNSIAMLIYGSCTFLAGLGWVLWRYLNGTPQYAQTPGVWAAIGVGIAFTFVTLGLYVTFGAGAPISLASPSIRLGGLLIASLAGLILLQEPFNWRYLLGMLLACSGVYLIITR